MEKAPTGTQIVDRLATGRPWWKLMAGDISPWIAGLPNTIRTNKYNRSERIGRPWDGKSDIAIGEQPWDGERDPSESEPLRNGDSPAADYVMRAARPDRGRHHRHHRIALARFRGMTEFPRGQISSILRLNRRGIRESALFDLKPCQLVTTSRYFGGRKMSERAKFNFISAKGIAEPGQKDDVAELRERLGQPGSKVLLHLHGGLVDRKAGLAVAEALSGSGAGGFGLKADWTQIYVIWQTGALEEISRRWTELAEDDQLYQALVRKLLRFIAQRTMLPMFDGRSASEAIPVSDEELLARIKGERDKEDPFADLEAPFRDPDPSARSSLAPERSVSALLVEFNRNLMADPLFKAAVADLDAAVNIEVEGRVQGSPGSADRGRAILERLGSEPRADLERPAVTDDSDETEMAAARGAIGVSGFVLTRAMRVALRCITRFRTRRDHGLHSTIVEEVCREFYGSRIGAKIWGWMVDDAALHFGDGKLGTELLAVIAEHPPERMVVTAHSAGSIWASRMLLAMAEAKSTTTVDLCLLAPAVRTGLFAETIAAAGDLVRRCQMFTMDDALERADAVLGHGKGYIYPSSLLYLVSGLFETRDGDAYEDAPILGMQRFTGVDWLKQDEARDAAAVSAFFSQSEKAIHYSKGSGLTDAVTHGGFDDNALTLGSIRERFLA